MDMAQEETYKTWDDQASDSSVQSIGSGTCVLISLAARHANNQSKTRYDGNSQKATTAPACGSGMIDLSVGAAVAVGYAHVLLCLFRRREGLVAEEVISGDCHWDCPDTGSS